MRFIQHYSSSAGNLYEVVADSGKRLLIDPGVTWSKLLEALSFDLKGIDGALCGHEHADHSKAVRDVIRAGIEVYASEGTLEALGIEKSRRANIVQHKMTVHISNDFTVFCFNTNHDAKEPLGFVVKCDDELLLFATDTSHIVQRFKTPFSIIAIECSYNAEYLAKKVEAKEVNEELAKRLLTSHMEEKEAMRYIEEFCDLSRCREIHLLHLSADNIHEERICTDFEKKFFIRPKTVGSVKNANIPSTNNS